MYRHIGHQPAAIALGGAAASKIVRGHDATAHCDTNRKTEVSHH